MIWHIFKKDALLLWPFALTLTIAQVVGAALVLVLGQFHEQRELAFIATFYPYLVFLGIVVLTITVVHHEPLWGVRQDWLMRPIARRDLLLAKAVFVVLMIHLPILVVDVAEQLLLRLSLVEAIEAAVSRSLELFCTLTLPALLLGAVTVSLMEALILGIAIVLGCTCIAIIILITLIYPSQLPSGFAWIATASSEVFMIVGAAVTLSFAYSRRRLLTSRVLGVLVVLAAIAIVGWLPLGPAFAIQQTVSGTWGGQKLIQLRFEGTEKTLATATESSPVSIRDPLTPPSAEMSSATAAARDAYMAQLIDDSTHSIIEVRLPLQISGMPRNSMLIADQTFVRLIGADGADLYQGVGFCVRMGIGLGHICRSNILEVYEKKFDAGADAVQQLNLPAAIFVKLKDRPVTVELDYALTLLNPGPMQTMAAIDNERHPAGLGSCATRIDGDGDEVQLRCRSATAAPSCAVAFLSDPQSGHHNPMLKGCEPNYVPFPQSGIEDVLNTFGLSLPFRDLSGLVHYPIDETRIQSAQVSLTAYHPTAHFRRSLVIPNIRLADWEATRAAKRAVSVPQAPAVEGATAQ